MKERDNMKELIKITTNEDGQQLVSARELHEFLEVKTRFNDWISGRVKKYDFLENIDFVAVTKKKVTAQGNQSEYTDYAITIDVAKELSMVENNDKGKQARKYFIKCEEKLKEEMQNKELTEADRIVKLLNVIPESERGKYMLELVDRFYPIGNSNEAKAKYEPRINKNKLNYDLFKKVLNDCYDKAYIDNKVHKGIEYVVIDKKILEREFISIGIDKKVLNRFIRENKPCIKAQIWHGEENKNKWEYFFKKELFE